MQKDLHPVDPKNNLESSGSTPRPNNGMGQHCMMTRRKRKACEHLQSLRKRQRIVGKNTEVALEAVMTRGAKRQLRTVQESPKKKRVCNKERDTRKRTEVPAESKIARGTRRKVDTKVETPSKKLRVRNTNTTEEVLEVAKLTLEATAEQPPAAETLIKTQRKSGCDLTTRPRSPSTSRQDDGSSLFTPETSKDFEAKYLQLDKLGEGGFGSVYAGFRRTDFFPVAIKHIPKEDVESRPIVLNRKTYMVPTEVLLMQKVTGGPASLRKSAFVSLLDWYDMDKEVLLVMERPVSSTDLFSYLSCNNGPVKEEQAKHIMKQLVEAAIQLHEDGVFHRDIKTENVLVEFSSDHPRVQIIDFGCGCFTRKKPFYSYSGTSAYIPPEFYIQGRYKAGPTTVWQLGALLYEMLDGHKQFKTSEFLRKNVRFLSEIKLMKVSQDCRDFLRMCLAMDPKQRATLEQMQLHPWLN